MSLVNEQWESLEFRREYDDSAQWSAVLNTARLSSQQKSLIKRLVELSKLPNDWDSYGSPAVTLLATELAQDVIYVGEWDFSPNIAPISGGGIQFAWNMGARSLELDISDEGIITYFKAENDEPLEEGVIEDALAARLRSLVIWVASGAPVEEAA
jgi:hypothetical protein